MNRTTSEIEDPFLIRTREGTRAITILIHRLDTDS